MNTETQSVGISSGNCTVQEAKAKLDRGLGRKALERMPRGIAPVVGIGHFHSGRHMHVSHSWEPPKRLPVMGFLLVAGLIKFFKMDSQFQFMPRSCVHQCHYSNGGMLLCFLAVSRGKVVIPTCNMFLNRSPRRQLSLDVGNQIICSPTSQLQIL